MLVKKSGEKNLFIAEEAEKALISLCEKSNEIKVVNAAIPLFISKINSIKVKSLFTLTLILERIKPNFTKFKDIDKII